VSAKKDAGITTPKYAFAVAVVGDPAVATAAQVRRLVEVLVNRYRGERQFVLLAPGGGPEVTWAHALGWSVYLVPATAGAVKQDCELVAGADAVLVLGDPGPWQRLLALCREARIPIRVYRTLPRLPPPRDYDPDRLYTGDAR
jgi:hypothetical protein